LTRGQRVLAVLGGGFVLLVFVEAILSIWVESERPATQPEGTLFGRFIIPGSVLALKTGWRWLEANDKPILVLLTLALLSVAGLLAGLTGKLLSAARDRGAAQAIEGPFLIPELTSMEEEDFRGRRRPVAVYALRNNGRSPAIVRRLQDAMITRDSLPGDYEEVWQGETLGSRPVQYIAIGPARLQPAQGMHFRCALGEDDIGRAGRRYLIARFEFEDLLGHSYVQGFSMQLPSQGQAVQHVISGETAYNYRLDRFSGQPA
jgi:hypothetical protein